MSLRQRRYEAVLARHRLVSIGGPFATTPVGRVVLAACDDGLPLQMALSLVGGDITRLLEWLLSHPRRLAHHALARFQAGRNEHPDLLLLLLVVLRAVGGLSADGRPADDPVPPTPVLLARTILTAAPPASRAPVRAGAAAI